MGLVENPPWVRSATTILICRCHWAGQGGGPFSPWRMVYVSTHKNESVFQSREQKLPLHLEAASQPRHLELLCVATSCQESQPRASRYALLCLEIWTTFLKHLASYYYHFCAWSPVLVLNERPPGPGPKGQKSSFRIRCVRGSSCQFHTPQGRRGPCSEYWLCSQLPLLELCGTTQILYCFLLSFLSRRHCSPPCLASWRLPNE